MAKSTKKEVLSFSIEQQKKYEKLVWFARVSEENMKLQPVQQMVIKIMGDYGEDVINLQGENGDFYHGFNSGCLAAFRFFITAMDEGIEEAENMFPELDT